MIGRNKKALAITGIVILVIILLAIFLLTRDDSNTESNDSSSTTSSSLVKNNSTTRPYIDLTTTSVVLDGISISLSTPFENQQFANETVPVRVIIAGATSGTCSLEFSKEGSASFELQAPVISAPTYFTCQGFDVEPDKFPAKGEWTLELEVSTPNGKSVSEKRKITIS